MGKQKKNRQGADKAFQKKKVKVGKKLPKSMNTTNTSFKTRTIQIIQQLKKDEGEATTKRKVNIKELLSQCQHYNVTVRLGAAKGLKELLLISEETVIAYLGLIVDRAGSLMTDKDCHVREAVLKLFQALFEKVPANCMSPFFPVLCAHLCCAMTHINGEIQQDSLSMFDLLLETYPQLVIAGSNQLMSNFVEQISKKKFKNVKGDRLKSNDLKFTLSVTPDSRLSSQKWQAKVLTRLNKLLSIVLKPENLKSDERNKLEHDFTSGSRFSVPFQSYVKDQWSTPGFVIKTASNASNSSGILEDASSIKQLVFNLFPLLLQCWVEAHDPEKTEGSLLYPDAISVRTTVLQITLLLIEYGARNADSLDVPWKKWLTEQYGASFENYFMSCFPYEVLQNKKLLKKQKQTQNTVSPETLNLAVISVMIKFIKCPIEFLLQQSWVQTILKYVRGALKSPSLSLPVKKHLLQVLNELIYAVRFHEQEALLNESFVRFENVHALSQEKRMYINFFSSVIFSQSERSKLSTPLIHFLESLPELLLRIGSANTDISTQVVSVIKEAISSNCTPVIKKWQDYVNDIFNVENGVFINSSTFVRKSLIEIFYWLHDVSPTNLCVLANLIENDGLEVEHGLYLIQVLHQRYVSKVREGVIIDKMADHLGFLLLVMSGSDTCNNNSLMDTSQGQITPIDWSKGDNFEKQLKLNNLICQVIATDLNSDQALVKDILWSHLEKKIQNGDQVNVQIVLSFMTILEHFYDNEYFDDVSINLLIDLASDLTAIRNGSFGISVHVDLVNNLFKMLEKIVCGQLIEKFVERIISRILVSEPKNENSVSLVQMLAHVTHQNSVQVYILENEPSRRQLFIDHFQKLVKCVQEKFPGSTSEPWWAQFLYFLELLK
ncbi:hypothetical protein SNE40_017113 [Patella caerulea]|uniref:Pre-rRNA-processing protein Ipi1 N-terminal domain-containing protein n=1 Tax=Patella caerulea TaxID=87958 RepID=A0AAN8JAH3_PATCE